MISLFSLKCRVLTNFFFFLLGVCLFLNFCLVGNFVVECNKSLDRLTAAESSGRNRRWIFLSFSWQYSA